MKPSRMIGYDTSTDINARIVDQCCEANCNNSNYDAAYYTSSVSADPVTSFHFYSVF